MLTFGGWNAILTKSVGDTDKKPTDKTLMWGLSSAGRASALQAEGHRFEPYRSHLMSLSHYAGVAELADAQDLKSCCRNTVPVRFRSPAL